MHEIFRPRVLKWYNGNWSRAARYTVIPCKSITDVHVFVAYFYKTVMVEFILPSTPFLFHYSVLDIQLHIYIVTFFFCSHPSTISLSFQNDILFYFSPYISVVWARLGPAIFFLKTWGAVRNSTSCISWSSLPSSYPSSFHLTLQIIMK